MGFAFLELVARRMALIGDVAVRSLHRTWERSVSSFYDRVEMGHSLFDELSIGLFDCIVSSPFR